MRYKYKIKLKYKIMPPKKWGMNKNINESNRRNAF